MTGKIARRFNILIEAEQLQDLATARSASTTYFHVGAARKAVLEAASDLTVNLDGEVEVAVLLGLIEDKLTEVMCEMMTEFDTP